jgi:hypothetical protein
VLFIGRLIEAWAFLAADLRRICLLLRINDNQMSFKSNSTQDRLGTTPFAPMSSRVVMWPVDAKITRKPEDRLLVKAKERVLALCELV